MKQISQISFANLEFLFLSGINGLPAGVVKFVGLFTWPPLFVFSLLFLSHFL